MYAIDIFLVSSTWQPFNRRLRLEDRLCLPYRAKEGCYNWKDGNFYSNQSHAAGLREDFDHTLPSLIQV